MRHGRDNSYWIFGLYLLLIVWVPIPLGSNRPWSWAILEVWVFMLSLAWLTGLLAGRYACGPSFKASWRVLLLATAWLGHVWFQLVPLPVELLALISPQAAKWHIAAAQPAAIFMAPLTLDRHATLDAACKSTAYVAFFALTLVLLRDYGRIRLTTYALILSGVGQALYGAFTGIHSAMGIASGTFVNRNHYAGYLVMCLSVGVGVLIASLSGASTPTWSRFFRNMIQWIITPKMALRLLLVTMVIALVISRSRMGNISFFVGLFVAGVIGLLLSRRATKSTIVLLASLIIIDVAIIGAYFGTERVVERIGKTTMQTEDRDELAGYTLRMWRDFPAFGAGLGSFAAVFPQYSGNGAPESYTHAHNDYLEFAAETGLIGVSLLGLIVMGSLFCALRAQHLRRSPVLRGIAFAATMGIVALMFHSAADFNLQIPSNALTFMLLLAFARIALHHVEGEAAAY